MMANVSQKDHRLIEAKILKNALDIIYHTGLLKNEVVDLNIGDVMPNGMIVSRILPLSGSYPRGFKKKPVIISSDAQKLFENHIEYLQANGFSISPKAALFPDVKAKNRYDESKLWGFLSAHCKYHSFDRHRIAGIHFLCWELSKKGHDNQQIIDTAHQFSRYSNINKTKEIMEEGISRNPKEYENVYCTCYEAAGKIIFFHTMLKSDINRYLSEFQSSYELLLNRDKNIMLNKGGGPQKLDNELSSVSIRR